MKKLSKRERVIMDIFWKNGPLTTSEVRELMPEPRPHINTISTQVRMLEGSGFLSHRKEGTGYRYFISKPWVPLPSMGASPTSPLFPMVLKA